MKRAVASVLIVVVVVGGLWWWNTRRAVASPVQYLTATAARTTVTDSVAATGTVQPQTTLALAFGSTGTSAGSSGSSSSASASSSQSSAAGSTSSTVSAVNVVVGQHVDSGAVLASVDGASQQAAVTAATGQLAVAQAQVTAARSQLSSALARLASDNATIAQAQTTGTTPSTASATVASDNSAIAQARLSVTQAQNGVTTATSSLAAARTAAASTSLTAPIAGIVTAVNLTVGTAAPSSAAIQLRSDGLQVVASVAELDITKLKAGLVANVTFPALGSSAQATLVALPTQANSSTGGSSSAVTFPVDLQLATAPPGLLPGMSAQISITIATQPNVLAVPTTAIQGSTASPTVEVMVNGAPQTRPVTIGLSTASATEIVAGINAGDTVVTGVVNPLSTTTGGGGGLGGLGGGTGGFGGTGTRTRTTG